MTTLDFLRFILPTGGYYAKMVLVPGGAPKQVLYSTVEELSLGIDQSASQGDKNVYFAVGSFLTPMSRKQDNTQAVKCLFVDIDCGKYIDKAGVEKEKPYLTKRDGQVALDKFIKDNGMPVPTIVDSGNGLHVYWVFTEELSKADWQPLADAFKRSLQHNKFDVDMAVPADSARVLRPIGTVNLKGGKYVKLLKQGPTTDPAFFQKKFLGTPAAPAATAAPDPTIPAHIQGRVAKVTTIISAPDYPPAHPGEVAERCEQIKWGFNNQAKVEEPFWYAMLGVAAHCLDSEDTAKLWSNQHPQYAEAATIKKLNQYKAATTGPTTCAKFKDLRPNGCNGCKFKDRISTPAQIGVSRPGVDISADVPDPHIIEVPLPKTFKRVLKDGVVTFTRYIDKTDIDVCNFDTYPVSYGRDEALGYEVVRYKWKRAHVGWRDIVMRQAFLNEGSMRECATALADQGIVLANGKQVELFQMLLRNYMEELRKLKSLTNMYQSMGWKEQNTQFLWGTTMFTRMDDGTVLKNNMAMSGTVRSTAQEMYHTSGSLQACVAATQVLQNLDLFVHMIAIGVALSAPLYHFTGIHGVILHLYGETGAGKSLAQHWMQSMWGDPNLLHFGSKFTVNSLFNRLSFHCHLPMTIDETTQMTPEAANNLAMTVSQGRDKVRLDKNSMEMLSKVWGAPVSTSANGRMSSMLSSSGAELTAQLMRILEVRVEKHKIFDEGTRAGKRLYDEVGTNYGWIGPILLEHCMSIGEAAMKKKIELHFAKFSKLYGVKFKGAERFWETMIVLADFALEEAKALGLIMFDHVAAMPKFLQQIGELRNNVKESRYDEFDMIGQYLNEHVRETLVVMHTGSDAGVVDFNQRRETLHVRQDIYRVDLQSSFTSGTMQIDKKHFRDWLAKNGGDYKAVLGVLERERLIRPLTNNKAVLGKGHVRTPQLTAIAVDLNHPRLKGVLDAADSVADNLALQKLTLVQ